MQGFRPSILLAALAAASAQADLKPDLVDCDPQKAARNAAMDATVGISGRCDPEKLTKDAREEAKEKVDIDRDKDKKRHDRKSDRALKKDRD